MELVTMLLVPLLVLPVVLLLRFVGCDAFTSAEAGPNYKDLVLGQVTSAALLQQLKHPQALVSRAELVGYWRLLDAVGSTAARDEAGFQDGRYVTGQAIAAVPSQPNVGGSDAAPGTIVTGVPGLIAKDASGAARLFNGGYVRIDDKPGLHPREFTLLAWVQTTSAQNGNEHVAVADGGDYTGRSVGLSLFVNSLGNIQATLRPVEVWTRIAGEGEAFSVPGTQTVRYGTAGKFVRKSVTGNGQCSTAFFGSDPAQNAVKACEVLTPGGGTGGFTQQVLMPAGSKVFVALTARAAGGTSLVLTLFLNAKSVASVTVVDWVPADGSPMLIGVRNAAPRPDAPVEPTRPFMGQIQDVALYRTALFPEVIENLYAVGAAT